MNTIDVVFADTTKHVIYAGCTQGVLFVFKAEKFSELVEEERIKRQQQSSLAQMNSSTAGVSVPGMPMNSMSYNPYLANQRANVSGGMNQQPPYPSHNPYSAYPATAVYP